MKSAYTLIEVVGALVIIAIAALALFEVLGNVLAGMNRVAYESKKTFEANEQLERYFCGDTSASVATQSSTLLITPLATSVQIRIVKPDQNRFGNMPLFIFEPSTQ